MRAGRCFAALMICTATFLLTGCLESDEERANRLLVQFSQRTGGILNIDSLTTAISPIFQAADWDKIDVTKLAALPPIISEGDALVKEIMERHPTSSAAVAFSSGKDYAGVDPKALRFAKFVAVYSTSSALIKYASLDSFGLPLLMRGFTQHPARFRLCLALNSEPDEMFASTFISRTNNDDAILLKNRRRVWSTAGQTIRKYLLTEKSTPLSSFMSTVQEDAALYQHLTANFDEREALALPRIAELKIDADNFEKKRQECWFR